MNILFIGLGSIGKRHFRNAVKELAERDESYSIDALRQSSLPLEPDIDKALNAVYSDFGQIESEYDAVFITNPSAAHYETLKKAVIFSKAVFIEKPVFTDKDADLSALKLRGNGVYYVACPLRRAPAVARAGELLKTLQPTAVRALCSSYLPDWRGSSDYRLSYSADPVRGGGVRLDLIHEWDYLAELFGEPLSISSVSGHFSALEIDSEDTSCYLARYQDMLLTLHLDYTGRAQRRELELFCEEDTVVADILKNEVRYLKSGVTEQLQPVDIHLLEMQYFLDLVVGKEKNINTVDKAMRTLRLALK